MHKTIEFKIFNVHEHYTTFCKLYNLWYPSTSNMYMYTNLQFDSVYICIILSTSLVDWPYEIHEAPPAVQIAISCTGFYFPSCNCQVEGKRREAVCRIGTILQSFLEELRLSNLGHEATDRSQMIHKSLYRLQIAQSGE